VEGYYVRRLVEQALDAAREERLTDLYDPQSDFDHAQNTERNAYNEVNKHSY